MIPPWLSPGRSFRSGSQYESRKRSVGSTAGLSQVSVKARISNSYSSAYKVSSLERMLYTLHMLTAELLFVLISSCCTLHLCHVTCNKIMLSGYCHLNPCPTYIFRCGVFEKLCKSNQNCIACNSCNQWFHTKCMDMPLKVFKCITANVSWLCTRCGLPYQTSPQRCLTSILWTRLLPWTSSAAYS